MSVSNRTRYEVLRRDNHACRYCGAKAPGVHLQVDHVIPKSRGGSDDPSNLTAACVGCNQAKGNGVPHEDVIRDVRHDEHYYQSSKGFPVYQCIHCGKPVQHLPDEELPSQCSPCNEEVCKAYDAGIEHERRRWQIAVVQN
ncbi:HNH endonuclease [Arthrobacter sp. UYCu723]